MNFESLLFEVAPWTQEVMQEAKRLNQGSFLRGRTGWIRRDVENAESIYEHSCKVGLAAYYLFGTKEAVSQGVVHDFAEIFEEDYIPGEICINDKSERELAVMKQLKNILPNGDYWFDVWNRFENQIGVGKHIAELDKICPSIQAVDYLKIYREHKLEKFYPYTRKKIETQQLIELLDTICLGVPQNESAYNIYFRGLEKIQL